MKLNERQLEFFDTEGYLVVDKLFDDSELQPVIDDISNEIDRLANILMAKGELSQSYSDKDFTTRLTAITTETDEVLTPILSGKLATPGIFSLLTNVKLLDAMESLLGSEIIAASAYRLRPKLPKWDDAVVPWHQDSAFFEPYCDSSLIVTVWIPLVDATAERGCLQVIPRQHKGGIVPHHLPSGLHGGLLQIKSNNFSDDDIVTVPVPKGGALLLTNRTPHRSIENVSDVIRWSMDLRYQSATLPTNFELPSGELFFHPDDHDAPVACYPPEADFLVRSQEQPNAVVTDWKHFYKLRTNHQGIPATDRWGIRS
jgi:ectoine hydroxylase-related dioxygenase (phytanoyl-CoA dioxygenase family)